MSRFKTARPLTILAAVAAVGACTDAPSPIDTTVDHSRRSAALRSYSSCDALATDLRDNTAARVRTQLLQQREMMRGNEWGFRGEAGAPQADNDAAGGGREEGVDFSGTNNQEQGVDEADLVKTDGYFIYTVNGDRLEILGVPEFGELTQVSSTRIEGYPSQLLLSGDRAVVFSSIYAYDNNDNDALNDIVANDDGSLRNQSLTKITVLSLGEDRRTPTVERELYLEGWLLTGRRIDDVVRVASFASFEVPGLRTWLDVSYDFWDEVMPESRRYAAIDQAFNEAMAENARVLADTRLDQFVPRLFERRGGRVVQADMSDTACSNVSIPEDGVAAGFTSILSLGVFGDNLTVEADHVVTNSPILYSSTDTLVIAEPAQDWWWFWGNENFDEATNIHRFALDGVTTTYTGSGRVDGTLLGQFALDVHDDVVRVAATMGQWNRWWSADPEPSTTHLVTLGGDTSLDVLGSVGGIAPGERLWSVRFTDSEAYLVTFEQTDPLWTIDLSTVQNPRIVGELEVPGVSTYIHPLGDHLLTIGIAGTNEGLDWGVTQLSMFDITDRTKPTLESSLQLSAGSTTDGWQYSYSEATYEHKAFTYWGPLAQVAVPLSTYRWQENGGYDYKSELILAHAEAGQPLSIDARIDHSVFFNTASDEWWDSRDVRRSIFMGDFIYAISDKGITCTRLSDLQQTASVTLRGANAR